MSSCTKVHFKFYLESLYNNTRIFLRKIVSGISKNIAYSTVCYPIMLKPPIAFLFSVSVLERWIQHQNYYCCYRLIITILSLASYLVYKLPHLPEIGPKIGIYNIVMIGSFYKPWFYFELVRYSFVQTHAM